MDLKKSQLLSALYTIVLVGIWGALGALAIYQWDVFGMSTSDWSEVAVSAITAIGTLITNWINPLVTRYGVGSATAEPAE